MNKRINLIILTFLFLSINVFSETFIMKNGTTLTGTIMEYFKDRGKYIVNILGNDGIVKEVVDVKVKDVESIMLVPVVTGITGNKFINFKYGFEISKPDNNWFFIENQLDIKPIITIARSRNAGDDSSRFRLFIYGPYNNLDEKRFKESNTFKNWCKDFFIRNFKMYIGYEDGFEKINNINYYWRIANHFVYAQNGREIKMKYKQYVAVNGKYVYVMDYSGDEKKFARETGEISKIVNNFQFLKEDNIYFQIANIFYSEKNYEKALSYMKKAVKFQNYRADLFQKMGDIYGKLGQMNNAKTAFEKALELKGDKTLLKYELDNLGKEFYNGIY